jgi:hypothetical protein
MNCGAEAGEWCHAQNLYAQNLHASRWRAAIDAGDLPVPEPDNHLMTHQLPQAP